MSQGRISHCPGALLKSGKVESLLRPHPFYPGMPDWHTSRCGKSHGHLIFYFFLSNMLCLGLGEYGAPTPQLRLCRGEGDRKPRAQMAPTRVLQGACLQGGDVHLLCSHPQAGHGSVASENGPNRWPRTPGDTLDGGLRGRPQCAALAWAGGVAPPVTPAEPVTRASKSPGCPR